jgi:hypothetical protein
MELDTVINDEHFHMNSTRIEFHGIDQTKSDFNKGIINALESDRKKMEKERHAVNEYIDSMRVILFTNVLGLKKEEAEVFWPAYNEYQNRLNKIWKKREEVSDKLCDPFRKYTIKEYAAFVDTEVKSYREEALLREQYAAKFKTILSENYHLLYRAEYLFTKWIFNNIL